MKGGDEVDAQLVESRLERFLHEDLMVSTTDSRFTNTVDLFEAGYVDSVGFAELLALLADEFGVEVPESDLLSDEFSSVGGIARVVARLVNGAGPP
jgi:acyl carrier protein